jgi:signal transduction histidine kinase
MATLLFADLRAADGRTLVATDERALAFTARTTGGTDTTSATPLFAHGDSVFIEYGAPVREGGAVLGRVAQVRHLSNRSAASTAQVLRLIGPGAQILLGNADGSVWTDLRTRVYRPAPSLGGLARYERDGVRRVSAGVAYPGALVASVEMPEDLVLAPLRQEVLVLLLIGVATVALAGAAGWWVSSGLTRPIARLAEAAERIAAGDLTSPVAGQDAPEPVNRLSASFEAMRQSVKQGHDTLEAQVIERTRELREAQDALVKKERLATLGQLSSSVGHELRNPLGVMTNAIYFLEMTLKDVPQKVRDYLGILRTQVRISEKIVSDLLDFARVKPPQRTAVPVRSLVDDQLARVAIPPTVRVDVNIPADLPAAHVDAVQIGQVVLNLVANAAQAMEEAGGVLTVRASARDGVVQLDVTDTGPGIAPEHLAHVFEPLFTTKARGIGLGLSVSRSLAAANGGTITVASEPGRGATFTLELPTRGNA